MNFRLGLRTLKDLRPVLKDAVFPLRCCGCGCLFRRRANGKAGFRVMRGMLQKGLEALAEYLCETCARSIELIRSPFCTCCGRPFESRHGVDHICGGCLENPFEFSMARSAGLYGHALKDLICLYKYQFRSELGVPLSRLLWQTLLQHWDVNDIDCVIPVPLHRRRLRARGFNQAELLVGLWPRLACEQAIAFDKRKLLTGSMIRCRSTLSQTGLDRSQRADNLRGAFKIQDPAAVQGRRVLLVDDVLTSGATADACSRALIKAKAASVDIITLARAA